MAFKVLAFSLLVCLVQISQSKDFPKNLPRCRVSDSDCIVKVANDVVHNHPNGFPELNLDSFEPFRIDDIKIKGDPSSPINFNLEMTGLSFHGYSTLNFTKFEGFKKDPKDLKLDAESVNKHVEMTGKYKISGKMLVFPITGEGDIKLSIDGLHIKSRLKPTVEVKDGKEYLKMDYHKLKVKADHMNIEMTNLFNGDKVLGENMSKILNENWKVLWDEMEPIFCDQITVANGKMVDKVLNGFPYKDFFITDE